MWQFWHINHAACEVRSYQDATNASRWSQLTTEKSKDQEQVKIKKLGKGSKLSNFCWTTRSWEPSTCQRGHVTGEQTRCSGRTKPEFFTRCSGRRATPIPKNGSESPQIFFLLLFHPLSDICPSQGEHPHLLGCSPGRFCSAAKANFNFILSTPLFPFLTSRNPALEPERKWSTSFHIPGAGKAGKSRSFRVFTREAKSYFNQNTHYASHSWLILHPFLSQGE